MTPTTSASVDINRRPRRDRGTGPAYLRGLPSSAWRHALDRRHQRAAES